MKKILLVLCLLFALCITANAEGITIASENIQIYEGKTYLLIPYGETDAFTFTSDNPAIAPVDETGLVRAITPGEATILITEPETNAQKSVAVTVKKKEFAYSLYCPPTEEYITPEQFAYMQDVGINTVILNSGNSEETTKKYLKVANPFDISFIVNDERSHDIVNASDETIAAYVNAYKDYDNVIGYYIKDEPIGANPYAPVYRKMADLYPDGFFHLNFYPTGSVEQFGITYDGYIDDWISLLGPKYKKTISFDNYPFQKDHYNEALCMYHFEIIRKYARKHDVDFEYFVQASGLETGYQSNENSVRYHFSIGLAYGAKSYQYFTWFTPLPTSEPFIPGSAIMTSDGKKGALYDVAKDTNARARKIEPYLAPAEAVRVYHTGNIAQNENYPPTDFFFRVTNEKNAILSLYHNEATDTFYMLVVNKDYTKGTTTYDFSVQSVTEVYDLTNGTPVAVPLQNGSFSADIAGGLYRLYTFRDGFSVDLSEGKEDNLAKNMPAYVSSSVGNNDLYAQNLTDGDNTTHWSPIDTDAVPYVLIDLKAQETVGCVIVKAYTDYDSTARVSVSRDNAFYRTVSENMPLFVNGSSVPFDGQKVRYVKIELPAGVRLSEVGVYKEEPRFVSHAVPFIEEGAARLRTFGNFENHHLISALYVDGKPVKVRILSGDELKNNEHKLFDVFSTQNTEIKTFVMHLSDLVNTVTFSHETPMTYTETFTGRFNTTHFMHATNGSCSLKDDKLSGFAYSFGTKDPIFIQAGYTFSVDVASPAADAYHNSAGITLRADRCAAPYYSSKGIILFICGDKLGIRTRIDGGWAAMMADGQELMPLPVSFDVPRKLIITDNGSNTITLSAMDDSGVPVTLGYILIDANGATLYNADKSKAFGTVPASMYGKSYVGVYSHLTAATFDNFEVSYGRSATQTEAFDNEYDKNFWVHTQSKGAYFDNGKLEGLALSFGTINPIPTQKGYTISMDIAVPYGEDKSPAMSAGIVLRSKKLASTYNRGKGLILLVQEDRIGLRTRITRSNWKQLLSEEQEMLPIPVSFKTERKLVVRDNGTDEIRILSYDDSGAPIVLGYIQVTPSGATLYNADKTKSFGTANAEIFEDGAHVGVCQFSEGASFDNISLTYAE